MSESAQTPAAKTPPPASKPGTGNGPGRRTAIVAVVGALLIAGAVGWC